ncbi:MAG: NAD(P)-dependent oxidoreductase [Aliiglaciecola sp.]|uniref:NAD(P)-dependent oxidoreductase n=1 Tax=Aliiglaciecola sp. TaxID=1872441 RepID=UPI003298FDB7
MTNQNHSLNIAFLGLGVMGFPMAGYLANAGHKVTVYNRTPNKAELWLQEFKGDKASTPEAAAKGKDVVFACVGNDDDLREVTIGDKGAFNSMGTGSIFVDHTTTSASVAQELSQIGKSKNIGYADAPVSGGQAGAQSGSLTVMIGTEPEIYQKIESLIRCYAKMQKLLGPVGSGQMAKMVNQICIAGVVQGLSEALHFAKQNGLDAEAVVEVISKGAAQSWQMDNRASTMLDNQFDFGFAVDWMRKDLGIVLDQARVSNAHLPLTALVDQFYSQVQANGGGRFDTSSLITLLEKN